MIQDAKFKKIILIFQEKSKNIIYKNLGSYESESASCLKAKNFEIWYVNGDEDINYDHFLLFSYDFVLLIS